MRHVVDLLIQYGPLGVFLLALVDSAGIPLPATMDALLLLVAVKAPEKAWFTAAMAVIGSTAGNIILFHAAAYGRRRLTKGELPPGKRQKFQAWFRRYGLLTVFIPAVVPLIPLPLKVFVISAGAFHTPMGKFIAVVLLARIIRYFGEAYLGIQLGEGAHTFLQHNAWTLIGIAIGLVLALYVVIRISDRRRPAM